MKKTLTTLTALSFTLQANDNINKQIDSVNDLDKTIHANPNFTVSKTVSLTGDTDGSGNVSIGDILTYQISTTNNNPSGASGSFLNDTIDANTILVVGSVTTDTGIILIGNNPSDNFVKVSFGTLLSNTIANVQFSVLVVDNNHPLGFTISNQAILTSNFLGSALSDDPSEPGDEDPTLIKVLNSPKPVPANSSIGLLAIILSILTSVKLFFTKKRKIN